VRCFGAHFLRPFAGKVLLALDFLQRKRMLAHGNVKGSNVLVSSNGAVKLSDLQSCKKLREEFRQSSLSIVSGSGGHSSDKRFRCSWQL
jgi:serine/threonine protein kinase